MNASETAWLRVGGAVLFAIVVSFAGGISFQRHHGPHYSTSTWIYTGHVDYFTPRDGCADLGGRNTGRMGEGWCVVPAGSVMLFGHDEKTGENRVYYGILRVTGCQHRRWQRCPPGWKRSVDS